MGEQKKHRSQLRQKEDGLFSLERTSNNCFSQILQVEKYLLSPEVHIYRRGRGKKGYI
jgi:hypothetical protein